MKGFKYIVVFFVCLIFASCAKQEIRPTEDTSGSATPMWRSAEAGTITSGDDEPIVTEGIIDPNDRENFGAGSTKTGGGDIEIVDPRDNN